MKNKTKTKTCGTRCLLLLLGVLLCMFSSCTSSSASEISTMAMPQVCAPMTESLPSETMAALSAEDLTIRGYYQGTRAAAREILPGDQAPRVLMYHLVRDDTYGPFGGLFVRVADMEQQLQILQELGCTYLFADEYQNTAGRSVMLTFDDGYDDNYTNLFPLLIKYDARATIFLVTDLIGTPGYLTVEQIREMADSGYVRFGSHTLSHSLLATLSEEAVRRELEESQKIISQWVGSPVRSLAYPSGSYNALTLSCVMEYYDYCYTVNTPIPGQTVSPDRIPRYYIARDLSMDAFRSYVR